MHKKKSLFIKRFSCCPVCLSRSLERDAFVSSKGIMSLSGYKYAKCRTCGSYFVNPQPTKKELDKFYGNLKTDKIKSVERIQSKGKKEYYIKNRINPIERYITKDAKIFDVGCGFGTFVKAMTDRGYDCAGSDISEASIKKGREIFKLEQLSIKSVYYIDREYDLISAWTVIEHLADPERFLKYANSKLTKNGLLVIEFPTVDSLMFEKLGKDFFWVMPPYHLFLFSIKGMKALLKRTGFEILEAHQMPTNWYWFDSIARSVKMSPSMQEFVKKNNKDFVMTLDCLLDGIAHSLDKSSAVQFIARKIVINKLHI